eukprot:TRINITY_DN303_c0_g2_i1.p1 TRINITY_DN303_c0_g2~~TRINITY_DN303_c0_g2_i1.p1  ORF type:complete len:253 (+),score=41.28 TRINITY_DN303_c0_g2_i1:18-776(+)
MKLFLLSLLLLFSFSIAETYFPEINIPLVKQSFVLNVNHRLSDDSYVPLGTISVDLDIKKQKGSRVQTHEATFSGREFTEKEWKGFMKMAKKDAYFGIEISGEEAVLPKPIRTSVFSCSLLKDDLLSGLDLVLLSTGRIIDVHLSTQSPRCSQKPESADAKPLQMAINVKITDAVAVESVPFRPRFGPESYPWHDVNNMRTFGKNGVTNEPTAPIPINAEAIPPVEEKTFFQKYWHFILPAAVFLLLQMVMK